jgi:formate-dependent nitrite reductase cytochrome c552 subunit
MSLFRKVILVMFAATGLDAAPTSSCAPCHKHQTESFARTGMARALEGAKDSAILRSNTRLAARIGGYSYLIERTGDASIYTVTDGKDIIRVPIDWAFGQGTAGLTYVFRREGHWYESRVSYFSALRGLEVTMGAQGVTPRNLNEAAGRQAEASDMQHCFDCHATNVSKLPHTDMSGMVAGIQCERCHGATEAHLKNQAPMRKLNALDTEEMSDLCGECHRTWSQIATDGPRGVLNVRFQPYRLATSKCYDAEDARIRCTSCHDPHREVETSAAAYDAKCQACHSKKLSTAVCRVATKDCVTCHMPRIELPGAQTKFTDHRIRVVRANEKYPD